MKLFVLGNGQERVVSVICESSVTTNDHNAICEEHDNGNEGVSDGIVGTYALANSDNDQVMCALSEAVRLNTANVVLSNIRYNQCYVCRQYWCRWACCPWLSLFNGCCTCIEELESSIIKYLTITDSEFISDWNWNFNPDRMKGLYIENSTISNSTNKLAASFISRVTSVSLWSLTIKYANIESIDRNVFVQVPNLRTLSLCHNRLKKVNFIKQSMESLWSLDLSHNEIYCFPAYLKNYLPLLSHLNLNNNHLKVLSLIPKSFATLRELRMINNDYNCTDYVDLVKQDIPMLFEFDHCSS